MIRRKPRSEVDPGEPALKFSKERHRKRREQVDTSGMAHGKVRPDRNPVYLAWLHSQPCAVAGKVDARTGLTHICWSPERTEFGRPQSDPCHTSKFGLGVKGPDSECFAMCRAAHDAHEHAMDAFDRAFGIGRFKIARELFARFESSK